jgi:gas vesicle protein
MSKQDGKRGLAIGAIFGAVVGLITGFLTAPKSGKETREDIKEKADQLTENAEKELKVLYRELSAYADKVRKEIDIAAGKTKKELEGLQVKLEASKDSIKDLLSTIRDGGADDKTIKAVIKQAKELGKELKKKN